MKKIARGKLLVKQREWFYYKSGAAAVFPAAVCERTARTRGAQTCQEGVFFLQCTMPFTAGLMEE